MFARLVSQMLQVLVSFYFDWNKWIDHLDHIWRRKTASQHKDKNSVYQSFSTKYCEVEDGILKQLTLWMEKVQN